MNIVKKKLSAIKSVKSKMGRPPLPRGERLVFGPKLRDRADVLRRCRRRERATGQSVAAQYRAAMAFWEAAIE